MHQQSPSQFGICSWSTHPRSPADLAGRMKELGLKKVQLALHGVYNDPATWGSVKSQLADEGMTIVSGMFGTKGENYKSLETIRTTGGFVPDEHWQANLETTRKTAASARALGLTMVSTHAGFIPDSTSDALFPKMVQRLREVADIFREHQLDLIFETGQETADALWQFLDLLDRANVGINFDPANMILYDKGDPIAALKKLMPRVKQVHIKDAVRTTTPGTWGKEVAIGDGEVDWKAFLQTLAEHNFRGNLVIEREAGADRVGDVRKAVERLSALMV
ncbi:MAG: TIM barrel protein [Phycisphaera sp.]|nr:TIM barrel protein [Phycisphaera sp.]